MHPEIKSDNPGICPECGMNLIKIKSKKIMAENFDKHAGHNTEMFLKKFWISLILSIPIVIYSSLPQAFFSWRAPAFPGEKYLYLLLGSIVFFYGGWVFLAGAWRELKAKLPGMMTLIALAIITAYIYSAVVILGGWPGDLLWELATLITIMLLGHWIEMKSVSDAQGALKTLSKLLPDMAEIITGSETKKVALAELKIGNIVLARPGGKIPADGEVVEGDSEVDEAMITGESKPVVKKIGDSVIAGTINGDGSLKIKITKIGEDTFLAGIMRLIKEAQSSKSRLQILSDKAAFYLTIIAIFFGSSTFVFWALSGRGISFALNRLVAVLVVTCPHALGLAIPLVAAISTTLSASNGILIKKRASLETARSIDAVLFDKTGTLTTGEYGVKEVIADDRDELIKTAASLDSYSEHFVSKAIVKEAKTRNLNLYKVDNFRRLAGKGVVGFINGREVFVGGEAVLEAAGAISNPEFKVKAEKLSEQSQTVIFVIEDKKIKGIIGLTDSLREESREAVRELKKMGIKTVMITGDSEEAAKSVAKELGVDNYFARVLPSQKSDKVKELQKQNMKVAMVGDGINDAPALVQADLGIAIGAGTNIAIESAGIILVKNDPRDIIKIIKLSKATYNKMIQNLFWATGYNVIAIPLAAGVLISRGVVLQPALSAVFMSLSTVIVAFNAVLLKRIKLS
ncbi:MAG: heavy metal translocating P-type ATPase [Patescibacteria group bacterium]|nr:heavy metal translocating P-type ATPase [Patescibacteria group bacterium]